MAPSHHRVRGGEACNKLPQYLDQREDRGLSTQVHGRSVLFQSASFGEMLTCLLMNASFD